MALTPTRVNETADAGRRIAERFLDLLADMDDFLEFNSDQAIDWAGDPTPAYIGLDNDNSGNIDGRTYSPAQVANLIGSMAAVRTLLTGGTPATGDHLANFNGVARPVGGR